MENVDWIHLTRNRDWWRAFVNTVMKLGVIYNAVNFLNSTSLITSLHGVTFSPLFSYSVMFVQLNKYTVKQTMLTA
jgi:hypothetical protein